MTNHPYGKKPTDQHSLATERGTDKVADSVVDKTAALSAYATPKSLKQRLKFALLTPLLKLLVTIIWSSCRVKIVGQANMDKVLAYGKAVIPCYWHQQHLFCGWYMLQQLQHGLKVGFLISPSKDGDMPAQIVAAHGARVIRGSSTRTGAHALREMYQLIAKDGVSPVTTSDGPTGPIFKFKPGAVMLSRMTGAAMLPLACAADRAWYLSSWDRFMLPKPFTRIVVAVGEPVVVDPGQSSKNLMPVQLQMEGAINAMMKKAKENL